MPAVFAQNTFDSWTTDDGLPQNSVYSIQQTPDGYLWFTTLDGLVRFDGVRFTVFNKSNANDLPSNRFVNLFAEADGTLWIATEENGLVRYRNREFHTFTAADGLPSNRIQYVQKDVDGSLLITTTNGLARFRDEHLTIERQGDFRDYKIYIASSGARWELDASGLRKSKDGQIARYDLPFDAKRINADRTFNEFAYVQMLEDRNGALWLAAAKTLFKFHNGTVTAFTGENGMPESFIRSLTEDRAGDIWLGTERDGVCRLSQHRIACYDTKNGLSSNVIRNTFLDREGTLWMGTDEGGINRLTRQIVSPLSVADGLAGKNIYPLLQASANDVWIGSFSALSQYKDGAITNFTRREGLLYEIVQSLYKDGDGKLWVGSIGGVEFLENGRFTDFTTRLGFKIGEADFWDIHRDRHGALWFATNIGLVKVANDTMTRYTIADGLPTNNVKIIHEARDGTLWIGTDGGLARSVPEPSAASNNSPKLRFQQPATARDSDQKTLTGKHIRAIYEDADGVFWIGTYDSGLSRLANGTITNYTTREGLFSNGVFAILEDGRGNLWMSSNQGIYRVSRAALNDFADGKTATVTSTAFGKSDGMLNAECNGGRQPAGFRANDGRLWFPTQNGVAIIDPEAVPFNPTPPPVVIESIKIDNILLEPPAVAGGSNLTNETGIHNHTIELQPNQSNLEIAYTGLSFIKPEQVRFRYKLEGLNEAWTEAGARRTAYFPYLPPGTYTFRVIAANSDNAWNEAGAAIQIVVRPPFWRTWWFTALALVGVACVIVSTWRYRVRQLHQRQAAQQAFTRQLIESQEAERKRIAAELHDSLGQTLLVIKNRAFMGTRATENAGATNTNLEAASEQFDEISGAAAEAINEVREIAYNLRPAQLERLGLTTAIKEMIEHVAEASGIGFDTDINSIDGIFSSESEINFYRIVQESLNNIVKHSDASAVQITIRHVAPVVELTIKDNGKGFESNLSQANEARGAGFGLTTIAERARILGGKHSINSTIGAGTTVAVRIALSHDE